MNNKLLPERSTDRRQFLQTSAAATAAVTVAVGLPAVHASSDDTIRVGLVGCGDRGTGAAEQCVRGGPNVKLVAMGDAFQDRLDSSLVRLQRQVADRVEVPANRKFIGLDAYQNVIANCDLVILATPPGFRPVHLKAAVEAGKHIFTEKPVAVDGPGVRAVLALEEEANRKNLCVVAGLQRHYQTGYLESMERIHRGDLGTITSARCYWNQGRLWNKERTAQMRDVEWQIRNWLYFAWLSGDHICEQHVHNLDVINWALQAHPARCVGMGGRQVRTGPEFGHIFDHFAVDYEYPNNVKVMSMCRQIEGCVGNVSENVTGTKGTWSSRDTPGDPTFYRVRGENAWTFNRSGDNQPYQQEHVALISAIRENRRINNLRYVAESTLTAIMGRTACYTGRQVTWEDALNSPATLMPQNLAFDMSLPVPPVPVPGRA
jgi:predicted dehydrogenase